MCFNCGNEYPSEELLQVKPGVMICQDCYDILTKNFDYEELERILDI